jgi:hypothetical protein
MSAACGVCMYVSLCVSVSLRGGRGTDVDLCVCHTLYMPVCVCVRGGRGASGLFGDFWTIYVFLGFLDH